MTWTYDNTIISTDLAKVRLRIGDTNTKDQLLSDEEINYYLDLANDDLLGAAVHCVRAIIATLSRDIDRSNLGMNATRSMKVQHYRDLLTELQKEQSRGAVKAYAGGMKRSDVDSLKQNTDIVRPSFREGIHDYYEIDGDDDGCRDD